MALDADPILTAIREVLEEAHGSLRTIASTRFFGELPEGLTDDEASLRAMERPRVEASITGQRRHPDSPSRMGSYKLTEIDVMVKVIRHLSPDHKFDDALRDQIKALAQEDVDLISQALTTPPNLATTVAGTATGLCTDCLHDAGDGATVVRVKQTDTGHLIETQIRFTGVVKVTQATS